MEKVFFKILPWASDMDNKNTIRLINWLGEEGYIVEIEYYEDKDNGTMPRLCVWGTNLELEEGKK